MHVLREMSTNYETVHLKGLIWGHRDIEAFDKRTESLSLLCLVIPESVSWYHADLVILVWSPLLPHRHFCLCFKEPPTGLFSIGNPKNEKRLNLRYVSCEEIQFLLTALLLKEWMCVFFPPRPPYNRCFVVFGHYSSSVTGQVNHALWTTLD